jgi:hypothetical protein
MAMHSVASGRSSRQLDVDDRPHQCVGSGCSGPFAAETLNLHPSPMVCSWCSSGVPGELVRSDRPYQPGVGCAATARAQTHTAACGYARTVYVMLGLGVFPVGGASRLAPASDASVPRAWRGYEP